jgi:hypothetical protein
MSEECGCLRMDLMQKEAAQMSNWLWTHVGSVNQLRLCRLGLHKSIGSGLPKGLPAMPNRS